MAFTNALVSTEWLAERLGSGVVRVFDCTVILDNSGEVKPYKVVPGRAGYEKARIPGAEFLDVTRFSVDCSDVLGKDAYGTPLNFQSLKPDDLLARFGEEFGVDSAKDHVVFYSQAMPMWATRLWWMLYAAGYDGAFSVLDGGLAKWVAEGRDVVKGEAAPSGHSATKLRPKDGLVKTGAIIGKEEMLAVAVSQGGEGAVVHALPRPSYVGETKAYGRAGHIPGAVNVPFATLLDPANHNTFLPKDALARAFADAGVASQPASLTAYCGAGISATVPLFAALTQLGWDCPLRLYDGSLSEWCADEACPLTVE